MKHAGDRSPPSHSPLEEETDADPGLYRHVSVIVPTHDTRELTLRCLETVMTAGGQPEVIVVDDASRDGTAEAVARRHPKVVVLRHGVAEGFTAAANAGLERAAGEILLLLNSDTEMPPDGLARLTEAFASAPRLGIAGASLVYPDGAPQWSGGSPPTLAWLFALASGLPPLLGRLPWYRRLRSVRGSGGGGVDWVTGAALAMRRRVWEQVGPLDDLFDFYGQDLDLCLRTRRAGWEVAVLPELRVVHHHGATIGREPGFESRWRREGLLWKDLLWWARKERGRSWARLARLALRAGSGLRLAGRRLATPLIPTPRRGHWRRGNAALAAAREGLRP